MPSKSRPLIGDVAEPALQAELKLAEMEIHEDVAECWDAEACPRLRREFAERYQRLIGVHPAQRHEFRAALEQVEAGGGVPVSDLILLMYRGR